MQGRRRSASLSLEPASTTPPECTGFVALGEEAAPLRFGLAIEEESSRTIDESLTLATDTSAPVLVRFPYKSVQDGQLLVLKVYRMGPSPLAAAGRKLVARRCR
jgi:hypothetical protein